MNKKLPPGAIPLDKFRGSDGLSLSEFIASPQQEPGNFVETPDLPYGAVPLTEFRKTNPSPQQETIAPAAAPAPGRPFIKDVPALVLEGMGEYAGGAAVQAAGVYASLPASIRRSLEGMSAGAQAQEPPGPRYDGRPTVEDFENSGWDLVGQAVMAHHDIMERLRVDRRGWGADFFRGLGSMLAMLPQAAVAGVLTGPKGAQIAGAIGEAGAEQGAVMLELINNYGFSEEDAFNASIPTFLVTAGATAALNKYVGKMLGPLDGDELLQKLKVRGLSPASKAKILAAEWGSAAAQEAGQEFVQESTQYANVNLATGQELDPLEMAKRGGYAATVGAAIGGGMSAGASAVRGAASRNLEVTDSDRMRVLEAAGKDTGGPIRMEVAPIEDGSGRWGVAYQYGDEVGSEIFETQEQAEAFGEQVRQRILEQGIPGAASTREQAERDDRYEYDEETGDLIVDTQGRPVIKKAPSVAQEAASTKDGRDPAQGSNAKQAQSEGSSRLLPGSNRMGSVALPDASESDQEIVNRFVESEGLQGKGVRAVGARLTGVAKAIADATGLRTVFVDAAGDLGFEGAYAGNNPNLPNNTVIINVRSRKPMNRVVAHEAVHFLANEMPSTYARVRDVMLQELRDKPRFNEIIDRYQKGYKEAQGRELGEVELTEEVVADLWAEMLDNPQAFREVVSQYAAPWVRVFERMRELLRRIKRALKNQPADVELQSMFENVDRIEAHLQALHSLAVMKSKQAEIQVKKEKARAKLIPAYHGTTHKFDKFSMDKIGTGEGAAAYGWGLYFASNEDVARWYRDKLTDRQPRTFRKIAGVEFDPSYQDESIEMMIEALEDRGAIKPGDVTPLDVANFIGNVSIYGSPAAAAKGMQQEVEKAIAGGFDPKSDWGLDYQREIDMIKLLGPFHEDVSPTSEGHLYKVDLAPEEDELLLWDERIDQQPPPVYEVLDEVLEKLQGTGDTVPLPMQAWKLAGNDNPRGSEIYRALEYMASEDPDILEEVGLRFDAMGKKGASLYLLSHGIRGIKYLDGNSRSRGEGDYNYVVFDDADVNVLARYMPAAPTVPEDKARGRVNRAINRRKKKGVGNPHPRRPLVGKPGKFVIGKINLGDWWKRVQKHNNDEEIKRARAWYAELHSVFEPVFGEETTKYLLAWALSQQQESPSGGLRNVLRALNVIVGKQKQKKAGLNEKGIEAALREEWPESGVGAKLFDFYDSVVGRRTRTVMGDNPRGLEPAAIDVWAFRDIGFIDEGMLNWLRKNFSEKQLEGVVKQSQGEAQYEYGVKFYNDAAKYLNEKGFDGGGWTAAEAQAVGWITIQRAMGLTPESAEDIIRKNIRRISIGMGHGEGSAMGRRVEGEVSPEQAAEIVNWVAEEVGLRVLGTSAGSGAYQGETEGSLQVEAIGSPEDIQDFMDMVGYVLQQTSVIATRPMTRGNGTAIDVVAEGLQDQETADAFFNELRKHTKKVEGYQQIEVDGKPALRFMKLGGIWSPNVIAGIADAINVTSEVMGLQLEDLQAKNISLEEASNDWTVDQNGEAYLRSLDQRGRVQEAERLVRRYPPQGVDQGLDGEVFWRSPEHGRATEFKEARRKTGRPAEPTVRPRPGKGVVLGERRQEDAVSYIGVHYGRAKTQRLLGEKFRSGIKGAEWQRLEHADDPRILKRIYFYIENEYGGMSGPEPGLGQYVYSQQFDNILGPGETMERLLGEAAGDRNVFESVVVDAGYDGYASPGNGILVILNHDVDVTYEGDRSKLMPSGMDPQNSPTDAFAAGLALAHDEALHPRRSALKRVKSTVGRHFFNRLWALEELENTAARKLGRLAGKRAVHSAGMRALASHSVADDFIAHGVKSFDDPEARISRGLMRVEKDFEKASKAAGRNPHEDRWRLSAYTIARRIMADYDAGKPIDDDILQQAQDVVAEVEGDAGSRHIVDAANAVSEEIDASLEYMVEAGLLTEETAERIRRNSKNWYVPLHDLDQVKESGLLTGSRRQTRGLPKFARGVRADTVFFDPLTSARAVIHSRVRAVAWNQVRRGLVEVARDLKKQGINIGVVPVRPRAQINKKSGRELLELALGDVFDAADLSMDDVINALADLGFDAGLDAADIENSIDDLKTWFTTSRQPLGARMLHYIDNGKHKFVKVEDDDLWQMWEDLETSQTPAWIRTLGYGVAAFRTGITVAPPFIVNNMIRDLQESQVVGKQGLTPKFVVHYLRGAYAALITSWLPGSSDRGNIYHEYIAAGSGMGHTLSQDIDEYASRVVDLANQGLDKQLASVDGRKIAGRTVRVWKGGKFGQILQLMAAISGRTESLSRLPQFTLELEKNLKRVGQDGYTKRDAYDDAAAAARWPSIDFLKAGDTARQLNLLFPFLNARIRGQALFFGSINPKNPKRMASTMMKGAIMFTLPTLLYWDKVKDEEWYQSADDWMKLATYMIPVGDQIIAIPRGHFIGFLFGGTLEYLLNRLYEKDAVSTQAMLDRLRQEFNYVDIPFPPLKAYMELENNRSRFSDRAIVPRQLVDAEARFQVTPYNTALLADFAQTPLARAIEFSPAKAEYWVRNTLGTAAELGLTVLDLGYRKATGAGENRPRRVSWLAFGGVRGLVPLFRDRYDARTRNTDRIFNMAEERRQAAASLELEAQRTRDMPGGEGEFRKWVEQNYRDLVEYEAYSSAAQMLGQVYEVIYAIQATPDNVLGRGRKKELVRTWYQTLNNVARESHYQIQNVIEAEIHKGRDEAIEQVMDQWREIPTASKRADQLEERLPSAMERLKEAARVNR